MFKVAAIQAEPVILDAAATLAKCLRLIDEAAQAGARFIVFPESFVPAYAHWAHSARLEDPDHKALHARLLQNCVRVPEDLSAVEAAAKQAGAVVVLPVTENDRRTPGTPYNTIAVFGPDGYLGKHRKLVPTHHERTTYGYGDGTTMRAFEATVEGDGGPETVRFGGLTCWNNFMPLARAALYQQGIHIYLAPTADDRLAIWPDTMRAIANESRCMVIAPCLLQRKSSFPEDFPLRDHPEWQAEPEWNERGGTCILAPAGAASMATADGRADEHGYLAGPVYEDETTLFAEFRMEDVLAARQTFEPMGHYGRTDILRLHVDGLDPL